MRSGLDGFRECNLRALEHQHGEHIVNGTFSADGSSAREMAGEATGGMMCGQRECSLTATREWLDKK